MHHRLVGHEVAQHQQEATVLDATAPAQAAAPDPARASFELWLPAPTASSTHTTPQAPPPPAACPDDDDRHQQQQQLAAAERAVSLRLLPPLLLLVIVSYMDRTALSFASLQFMHDLGLSSTLYGLGSGAFFLAYAAAQIPSNLLLLRFGGPGWLAAITAAWGAAAAAGAAVSGPVSFVALRLLLGLCEAGALPGTWFYISLFYPLDRTTLAYSIIETGITVSQVIAAPVAAGLLMMDGIAGLRGWQWLFLLEGLPALLLGASLKFLLPTSVETAAFLSAAQKAALTRAIADAAASAAAAGGPDGNGGVSGSKDAAPLLAPATAAALRDIESSSGRGSDQQRPQGSSLGDAITGIRVMPPAAANADEQQQALLSPTQHMSSSQPAGGTAAAAAGRTAAGAAVVRVLRNPVVLYAGSWRILHDTAGNGVLFWTPKLVQALLVAAGSSGLAAAAAATPAAAASPGVAIVLLSAIPYAAASLFHLVNAWHSQRTSERRLHIALTWLLGAVALVLLPAAAGGGLAAAAARVSAAASIVAFVFLVLAHVGVNGANGLQTGLVAGCLRSADKALGLAAYNTIGCFGSFLGPLLIGLLHDTTGGYVLAMVVLGCSLAGAAAMVLWFDPARLLGQR